MRQAFRVKLMLAAALAVVVQSHNLAQRRDAGGAVPARSTYVAPRAAGGHPDLQGVWTNNAGTPLERPAVVADKPLLNDAELGAVRKQASAISDECGDAVFGDSVFTAALGNAIKIKSSCGETGNYNQFWLATRWFDHRTSLIVDPPNGKLPQLTPEGRARQEASLARRKDHPADGPEDRNLFERCLMPGDFPNLLAGYNANFQILQNTAYVAIQREMMHDVRIIPTDARPHVNARVRQLLGDSRGRWDGETLVVDTTNFSTLSNLRGASNGLHLVERFTRIAPDTLQYEFTASDPTTWTAPWTARLLLKLTRDSIYEYACHEGNYGLRNIPAGTRVKETAGR
ncbi:MAG TPA: hypothetical protein VH417_18970 [Vicinamibacterales bacterium]|jgi:hypothetical protein